MIKEINDIKENINMDDLGEICQDFAESIEYTDENIIVLKISLGDLKSENFDNIIELGRVEYGEWDTLSSLVPNGEVDGIKKEFEEDLAMLQEDDYEDAEVDSFEQIYKSVLYCDDYYVWGGTSW